MKSMKIDSFSGKYRFLSNFYPCSVDLDNENYPSTEHAFQAAKTLDVNLRNKIKNASSPSIAKKLGRKLLLRDDWEAIKISIMEDLLRQKFNIPKLKNLLLSTGNCELIEGNYWGDVFWGVDINKGGQNNLGKLLMKIRNDLNNLKEK